MKIPFSLNKKYDTGLVLSGGAARGFAHLGVLKALEENNLKPEIVSGVSVGSIVGSFYANDYEPEEILKIFEKTKIFELVKVKFNKLGLMNISGLKNILNKYLRITKIEELDRPLIITATNINKGITQYFTEGNLINAVLASSSIPVLFKPTKIDGMYYVDGGVTNNFPIEPVKSNCKKLIGSHVNPVGNFNPKRGLGHLFIHTFHLSIASGLEEKKKSLDYFIEPQELKKYPYFDIGKGKEMFEIGYQETLKVLNNDQ